MDQHFANEFRPFLGSSVKMVPISGDSDEKDFFGRVVRDSNLVICTAQILENALINTEENKHVELTGKSHDIRTSPPKRPKQVFTLRVGNNDK